MIVKFDLNQTKHTIRPNTSSPNTRCSKKIRQHLTISNENSTASISANYKTGFIEIEHTVFGLYKQVKRYTFEPYESLLFLHANDFLLSLDLSRRSSGPSQISCVHVMNTIAATATLVEREPQVVRF